MDGFSIKSKSLVEWGHHLGDGWGLGLKLTPQMHSKMDSIIVTFAFANGWEDGRGEC